MEAFGTDFQTEFELIRSGLAYDAGIRAERRQELLAQLEEMIERREVNLVDTARLLHNALLMEISRLSGDQDIHYLSRLLALMSVWATNEALVLVDCIGQSHPDENIRRIATDVINFRVESFERLWNETPDDQVSGAIERAERLRDIPNQELDEIGTVQAIFNQTKGLPVVDKNDARLPALQELMSGASERVRLACAFAIASSMVSTN